MIEGWKSSIYPIIPLGIGILHGETPNKTSNLHGQWSFGHYKSHGLTQN